MRTSAKILGAAGALAGVIGAGIWLRPEPSREAGRRISAQDRLDARACVTVNPGRQVIKGGAPQTSLSLTVQDKPVIDHTRSRAPCYIDYTAVATDARGEQTVNTARTYWVW